MDRMKARPSRGFLPEGGGVGAELLSGEPSNTDIDLTIFSYQGT